MKVTRLLAILMFGIVLSAGVLAQTTEFSYQGNLTNTGSPANGQFDFEFVLFESQLGGAQIGATLSRTGVTATNGIFSVNLDFGANFPGAERWLEIRVRAGGGGVFTTLAPRQRVASSPYSVKSLAADTAANATNATTANTATNATTATNFTGPLAGDVSGTQGATTVARLRGTNVSAVAPANGQVLKFNSTTGQWQPSTDETSTGGGGGTITGVTAGTGLTGGGASGNVALSIANGGVGTTQLADGGVTDAKINSVSGGKVTGIVATATNAANALNLVGPLAGDVTGNQGTTTVARLRNVALPIPVVTDNGRVLKYKNNGVDPITYEWAPDLTGGGSGVTSVTASSPLSSNGGTTPNISLSGVVSVANGGTGLGGSGASGNLLRSNGSAWVSSPLGAADIPAGNGNYIQNSVAQQTNTNFNIEGNGTAGGTLSGNIVSATTQFNIGFSRVFNVAGTDNAIAGVTAGAVNSGSSNSFFGSRAGRTNTTGSSNSFFGGLAGDSNTTGSQNSFLGGGAGLSNTTGSDNSFVGTSAGFSNTTGSDNSYFGKDSGLLNTGGADNSFFGRSAGDSNTNGNANSFFGRSSGAGNTTGSQNAFFGNNSGGGNTTGTSNTFIGRAAGLSNTTGSQNVVIGEDANVSVGNLVNATAIGSGAVVSTSNTMVLGTSNVAVQVPGNLNVTGTFTGNISGASITNLNASNITTGTLSNARLGVVPLVNGGTGSATQNFVDLTTSQTIAGNKTFSGTLSGNVVNATNQYNINGVRVLSNLGTSNFFAGSGAGNSNSTGSGNAFFGRDAGFTNTTGFSNSFFGLAAGFANTDGFTNAFFGAAAGNENTTGDRNAFFGLEAGGTNTTGNDNTIIGSDADVGASNLNNATAIGANALVTQDNSIVLGSSNGVNGATATTSVGINTTAPKARLHVVGNIYVENNPNGLIIQSPNGSCFKITVSNAGVLSANPQACP